MSGTPGNLSTTQGKFFDILWRFADHRSQWTYAGAGNAWLIGDSPSEPGSDNHDAMRKGGYLLIAKALKGLGAPYGPNRQLADGHTTQQHYDAWNAFWKEAFKQRAREGLSHEHFAPGYPECAIWAYYNLKDLSGDAVTGDQARKFLDLFWADAAQVFSIGAQIHTVAGSRMYQYPNSWIGEVDTLRQWFYMYEWHNTLLMTDCYILPAAMSYYNNDPDLGLAGPPLAKAIATDASGQKSTANPRGYEYVARGYGRCVNPPVGGYIGQFAFPSSIRRSFYWTPGYVLGAETFDGGNCSYFWHASAQNRWCGVICNAGVDDRLFIQGIYDGSLGTGAVGDDCGITAFCSRNVIVAARDVDNQFNSGVRIFLPKSPYSSLNNNFIWVGSPYNWGFTYAGTSPNQTYIGIKIAASGYTRDSTTGSPYGDFLTLKNSPTDPWSPIVIQCGRQGTQNLGPNGASVTYNDFADFQNKVKVNSFTYSNNLMTYTSEAGDIFKMQKQNVSPLGTLPKFGLNGASPTTVNLNPTATYSSPYINGTYGQSSVTIGYPGFSNLVLNFDY